MFDILGATVPYGQIVGAFTRILVAISCLGYASRLLKMKSYSRGIPIFLLFVWFFTAGVSQGYDPLTGKLTVWTLIQHLLLLSVFARMALRNLHKEDL